MLMSKIKKTDAEISLSALQSLANKHSSGKATTAQQLLSFTANFMYSIGKQVSK